MQVFAPQPRVSRFALQIRHLAFGAKALKTFSVHRAPRFVLQTGVSTLAIQTCRPDSDLVSILGVVDQPWSSSVPLLGGVGVHRGPH